MRAAGGEGQGRGDELWWGRHATPQPEHMPCRWCTGCGGRRRRGDGKTPPSVPRNQELHSSRQLACWRGKKSRRKNSPWIRPDVDIHAGKLCIFMSSYSVDSPRLQHRCSTHGTFPQEPCAICAGTDMTTRYHRHGWFLVITYHTLALPRGFGRLRRRRGRGRSRVKRRS